MNSSTDGSFLSLEEIENLLSWQYEHLIELDDFLRFKFDGNDIGTIESIFIK